MRVTGSCLLWVRVLRE